MMGDGMQTIALVRLTTWTGCVKREKIIEKLTQLGTCLVIIKSC